MTDKQYLEAVLALVQSKVVYTSVVDNDDLFNLWQISEIETNRRLAALKAQEDNIKSDMWKEES